MAEWISAVMAVVSGAGALWAWWSATRSAEAKRQARQSEERAREQLQQMQEQTKALMRVARVQEERLRHDRSPGLEVVRGRRLNSSPRLINNSQEEVEVVELLNRDAFLLLTGLETPFTLAPNGGQREFRATGSHQRPVPPMLVLRLGDGTKVQVPL